MGRRGVSQNAGILVVLVCIDFNWSMISIDDYIFMLLFIVKTDDYFDSCVMEKLRHRLLVLQQKMPQEGTTTDGAHPNQVTFHSSVSNNLFTLNV